MKFFRNKTKVAVKNSVTAAREAQPTLEQFGEDEINEILATIVTYVLASTKKLAKLNVEETGLGVVKDKIAKIKFAGKDIYNHLKDRRGYGVLKYCDKTGITEIASPVGIVFGLVPATNPISTLLFKTLIALKTRNAIMFSCHRNTRRTSAATLEIIHKALDEFELPRALVTVIENPGDRELVRDYMSSEDVSIILATGGPSMVQAAYQSGKPAIGVGAGNAPVMICDDANLTLAANTLVQSKSFDNGIICGSENNVVVTKQNSGSLVKKLITAGAAVLGETEIRQFRKTVLNSDGTGLKKEFIGKTATQIAERMRIFRDYDIKLLVVPVEASNTHCPLLREKLAPIVSFVTVPSEQVGFTMCLTILNNFGIGHTAVIHSYDEYKIEQFALIMPASRILINMPASQGCIGMVNNLTPSLTLGCGTWGGGSTTDNINIEHLINVKRVARPLRETTIRAVV